MTPSSLAVRVETWLASTWHVKVPTPWLKACIDWIQQENGGSNLAQASINKQVFEQWLLTDLRDLQYPLLPDCILNDSKGELNGVYSIQIDSLVDVSQPAYSQLQKLRGKNTINEEITANTQVSLKSWEAKPTRMLMLHLTDGIHHIQGMEYHPVPVLHSGLPPGTKVMIHGTVAYRLGVLLLKPENVKLLGGEVDSLVEEYSMERVLAGLIGEEVDRPNAVRSNTGEYDISRPPDDVGQVLGPSDEELLASLEENDELMINEAPFESGYCSKTTSINSTIHSSNNRNSLQQDPIVITVENEVQSVPVSENMEDFDELPLDDFLFEDEIQQEQIQVLKGSANMDNQSIGQKKDGESAICDIFKKNIKDFSVKHNVQHAQNLDDYFREKLTKERNSKNNENSFSISKNEITDVDAGLEKCSDYMQTYRIKNKCHNIRLDTTPFTYLSNLLSSKPIGVITVKVKAFIVTLTGNLRSNDGFWNITAKISDGTAYLEVDFADEILTSLIGFSVLEMKQLRKDPVRCSKLKEGLQNCQRELIDLCCLITIEFNPTQKKATVIVLQDININDLNDLRRRVYIDNA